MNKYRSRDNNKLAFNFCESQTHRHKILVGKKIKPFEWPHVEKTPIFEPFPMKILTPSKRGHLSEIIKKKL